MDAAHQVNPTTVVARAYISGHDNLGRQVPFRSAVLIEMMAQAAACNAVGQTNSAEQLAQPLRLAQLRDVEFGPLPAPPFTVNIIVERTMDFGNMSLCIGSAEIDDHVVCTGKLYLSQGKLDV